jgi:hypothetical protein
MLCASDEPAQAGPVFTSESERDSRGLASWPLSPASFPDAIAACAACRAIRRKLSGAVGQAGYAGRRCRGLRPSVCRYRLGSIASLIPLWRTYSTPQLVDPFVSAQGRRGSRRVTEVSAIAGSMTPISSTSLARSSSSIRSHMNAPTSAIGASGSATRWSCCWRRACAWPTPAGRCAGRTWHGSRDPQFDGSRLAESKLLLVADQGYGDAIQFVRYIPSVRERCSDVIVAADPAMHPFIRQVSPAGQLVDRWERAARRLPPIARRRACHACTARRSQ